MMEESIVKRTYKSQKETSKRGLASQYENTESCWSFYNADQMTYSDRIQFEDTFGRKRRATVNFNKVQQNVDAVGGFMAQNRRKAKFIARVSSNASQQLYSRNMNAIYEYHRENVNAEQLESDQDLDMLVGGIGAIDTEISYIVGQSTRMPNGEILKKKLDPSCVYWDPSAKGKNISDARWAGYWEDFELRDALELFQDSKQEDFQQVSDEDPANTGYVFNPYGGIYDKIKLTDSVEWASKEQELVRVYNHQWMTYETFYKARNPLYDAVTPEDAMFIKMKLDIVLSQIKPVGDTMTGDMFDFKPTDEVLVYDERIKRLLNKELPNMVKGISFKRKVFWTAVCSGDHVFTWFKSISQQGFSIKFKTGTWNRTRKMWMGMVNPMMEPQRYYNKALTELMFTIAANSKGGVMVEEDAVEDIADFEGKWARTDAVIKVKSGALMTGKIQEKTRAALPTGLEGILQLSDANISANGVDPAFLGNIEKEDQSGILYKRRIRQVISKFAKYFDSITLYQKEDARLYADLIPVWVQNNQGEWMRITGEDGAEDFMQITEDMLAPEYDVDIQEASQSSEEKQETAMILKQYADSLFAAGDAQTAKAFILESLDGLRLDGEVRNRLAEKLQPPEQPQIDPMQFQMMQQQLQQLQQFIQSGQVEKTLSEAERNKAQAAKTMREIESVKAGDDKTRAETVKTLEEAQRTSIEVELARRGGQNVNVTI